MHPYHHALSSARRYGGAAEDYLPLHNWFDATKANMSFFTHHALRHHYEGVREAVHVFGGHIANTEGTSVAVETISLQHFVEDMSIIPSAADWLQYIDRSKMPEFTTIPTAEELADRSARRFATTQSVVLPVHQWFLKLQRGLQTNGISRCATTALAFSKLSNDSALFSLTVHHRRSQHACSENGM